MDSVDKKQKELFETLTVFNRLSKGRGLYNFIVTHGKIYQPSKRPKGIRKQAYQECFKNASLLSLDRDDLTYVEGYACDYFPTLHAWCVDKKGCVIDTTWKNPEECAYFGVPFKTDFLLDTLLEEKVYGLIVNMAVIRKLVDLSPDIFLRVEET
jgi:hypothetical protein